MTLLDLMTLIASVATAVSVMVAGYQIGLSRKQSTTQFEDSLTTEYRGLVRTLPVKAMLGSRLSESELEATLSVFYCYFDLCNEQIFLRQQNRVTLETWQNWCDGIRSNLSLPAFGQAWDQVKGSNGKNFSELKQLEIAKFKGDPRKKGPSSRVPELRPAERTVDRNPTPEDRPGTPKRGGRR